MKATVMTEQELKKLRFHLGALSQFLADFTGEPRPLNVDAVEQPAPGVAVVDQPARVLPPRTPLHRKHLSIAIKRAASTKRRKRAWTPERRAEQGRIMRERYMQKQQLELPTVNGAH